MTIYFSENCKNNCFIVRINLILCMQNKGSDFMVLGTLVGKDDTWVLWAIIIVWATISIF